MTPTQAIERLNNINPRIDTHEITVLWPFLLAAVEAAVEMRGHFPQSTAAIRSGSIKRFDAALSALARKVEEMER